MSSWGGTLVFVYLPARERYDKEGISVWQVGSAHMYWRS